MKIAFACVGDRPHAKYAVQSFKEQMPDAEFIQFTDDKTPPVEGVDTVIRRPYNGHMMLFMIESFSTMAYDGPFITTADDCIIEKPLYEEVSGDFDIAIVRREGNKKLDSRAYRLFPYTNGLVIVKHPEFYKDCFNKLLGMKHSQFRLWKYWDWIGDMACISEVLKEGKYRIKLLSESIYCRIPERRGEGRDGTAVLWHYAKKKKDWMQDHGKGIA